MSKKLIAVASAAALALTALVGIAPASAAAPTITETSTNSTGAGTASSPFVVDVPDTGIITVAAGSAILIKADALEIGDVVTFTATGAVRLLEAEVAAASANFNTTTLGKTSLVFTRTDNVAKDVWAYTTSTTVGTVAVSIVRTGTSIAETFYIEGEAGVKYNVTNVSGAPTTLANTATATVSFTVTDAFGNLVEASDVISDTNTRAASVGIPAWNASKKVYEVIVTSSGTAPFVASLDIGAAAVAGFPAAADSFAVVINSTGVAAQIAALTAQLAALTIIKDRKVSKLKYNRLAKKWNAAFPSQKVWVKP
jgi:hypothetical protein